MPINNVGRFFVSTTSGLQHFTPPSLLGDATRCLQSTILYDRNRCDFQFYSETQAARHAGGIFQRSGYACHTPYYLLFYALIITFPYYLQAILSVQRPSFT